MAILSLTLLTYLVALLAARFVTLLVSLRGHRNRLLAYLTHVFCRIFLRLFRIDLKVKGTFPEGSYLIVSNHVSYLDMVLIASQKPTLFITSWEMRDKPGIGLWVKAAGCFCVDRQKFTTLLADIKELGVLLDEGNTLTLFPEATTTNGTLLPFKPGLIVSAARCGASILPVALKYEVTPETKDEIYFYGTMKMVPHLRNIIKKPKIRAELRIGPLFDPVDCRKQTAKTLRGIVQQMLEKDLDDEGRS